MTGRQYKLIIKALGLNQAAAGRYTGVAASTSRRYITGAC